MRGGKPKLLVDVQKVTGRQRGTNGGLHRDRQKVLDKRRKRERMRGWEAGPHT